MESGLVKWFSKILKILISYKDLILINGGGYIGSLWINEEEMFRKVVTTFKKNNIIVFPQTIYFSNDEYGKKVLLESQKIYGDLKNLTVCCREKYSYEFMKREFPKVNILLVPDIVLYLDCIESDFERKDALFCIRQDKEKIKYNLKSVKNYLKQKYNYEIDYTDTVIDSKIYPNQRQKILYNKFNQFSKYKIIVTDRLHGMIFAYLTHTPCIVLENKSYKVKGVYVWIKDSNRVNLCINEQEALKYIDNLIDYSKNIDINLKEKFNVLISRITSLISKEGDC